MCEPTAILGAASAVAQQAGAEQATSARNRAKLKNHERNNQNYLTQVMLDNARWKNDVQIADVKYDQAYQAMMDQWVQQDKQLDKIFAKGSYKIEKAIQKMYQNDYAGTQTGRTAARLAAKSARELGMEKSQTLHEMMMSEEEVAIKKDIYKGEADRKQWDIYDKIRFTPIHGHAPPPPLMEAAPSRAGMFLSIATSAFGAIGSGAPPVSSGASGGAYMPGSVIGSPSTSWGNMFGSGSSNVVNVPSLPFLK